MVNLLGPAASYGALISQRTGEPRLQGEEETEAGPEGQREGLRRQLSEENACSASVVT